MDPNYDVIVLGGGPGGYPAALRAVQLGRKVAVVEGDRLGGVCLNRGCIPTKALLHVAEVLRAIRQSGPLGVHVGVPTLDALQMAHYRDSVVARLRTGVQRLLRDHGIDVIAGWGHLTGPTSVEIVNEHGTVQGEVTGKDLVLATGSSPRLLPGLEFDGVQIWSSDHAVAQTSLPDSIIIVGSGAVGTEFASFYIDAGVQKVTLVEVASHVLPMEDADVSVEIERQLRGRGVQILTGAQVLAESLALREQSLVVQVQQQSTAMELQASTLLVATGRRGNVEHLGLDELGVGCEGGFVRVDGFMRTNVPHLYAVGDVAGGLLLAHKATAEGRLAAEVIAGLDAEPLQYDLVPRCVYSYPEVASFGLSEEGARMRGYTVGTSKFPLAANSRAAIEHERTGFVKYVVDSTSEEILGVHAIGPRVTELIAGPAIAASLEGTPFEIAHTMHPHPTLSEAVAEAAQVLYGSATHG